MTVAVLERGLALRRRSVAAWAVGSAVFTAMIVAIFPVVRDDPTFDELLAEYPEPVLALIGGDVGLTTGPGFLSAELYSLMLPVVVAVIAVMTAADALAGEDERGWLALVLAGPLERGRIVVETAALVAIVAAGPVVASALVIAVGGPIVDLELSTGSLFAVSVTTWTFGSVFGAISLAVGCATGRRSHAIAAGVGALLLAYGIEIVGATADWGGGLREISPFHHLVAAQPAIEGLPFIAVAVVVLLVAGTVQLGTRLFVRRDLVG